MSFVEKVSVGGFALVQTARKMNEGGNLHLFPLFLSLPFCFTFVCDDDDD